MTNGIYTLELRNFKAFPESQQFKFEGKHVLMYGENGSGKSSIYWALYTLLQSTVPNKDFRKYFSSASTENLMNQQMISRADSDSYIQFSLLDRPEHFFKLSSAGLTGDEANSNRLISETNLASDFISHRLLTNVYNFRNSDEIDLFTVFERDVFPFLENAARENYSDLQKRIEKNLPFKDAHGSLKLKRDGTRLDRYIRDIEVFNGLLRKTIGDLNQVEAGNTENRLTNFYNEHLAPKDHNDIKEGEKLKLKLILEPMSYDFYKHEEAVGGAMYDFTSKDARVLKKPKVKIEVQRELDGSWRNINRPQSFFNEARLTRIALAIRFCILDFNRTKTSPTKILALDDLLISLDMSNRETVLDFLLSKYQNDFQLIILTHERAFFHLAKRKIERLHNKLGDWKLFEIYEYEKEGLLMPKVLEHKDHLAQAMEHFKETKDYPACINAQRSWIEGWCINFIPSLKRRTQEGEEIKTLNGLLVKAEAF
jgi:energy-coupling factor transporter ATP-binding protein EcfA2